MVKRGFECAGNKVNDISILPGFSATNNSNNLENYRYYYHPDHLGSSSFITNQSGNVIEHLQYLPYGENFVSQRSGRYDTPYKFSGKEKDEETQYSYFGARYYDSDLSIWLSVDPLASKYPSLSPYNYCANNPIIYVDPNGMDWYTNRFSGKQEWHNGSGWRLFASHNDGGAYQLNTTNVVTMSKQTERRLAEDLVSSWEFERDLNKSGAETYRTNSRLEALAGWFALGALPEFKGLGKLFQIFKTKNATIIENLVKIETIEDDVVEFSAKIGDKTVEGMSNFVVKDGKLFLDKLHLQGSTPGKVGRSSLWEMAKDLGRQFNVNEVIIQGGRRTTGKYKGQIPSPISIKVD